MENLPEDIDAVLDPVIGKQTIKRGRNLILKIGDAEVEYDQNFRWELPFSCTGGGFLAASLLGDIVFSTV